MNSQYYREIKPIIKELTKIFDPLCADLCPDCTISCCEPCVREMGYYKNKKNDHLKSKYGFNEKTGFLGPHGCLIPRLYRSNRCLYHICLRIQLKIIKEKGTAEFTKFKNKITELSEQHQKILMKHDSK